MLLNIYLAFLIFFFLVIVSCFICGGLKHVWDISENEIPWRILVIGLGFLWANVMV